MISRFSVVSCAALAVAFSALGQERGLVHEVKQSVQLRAGESLPINPLKLTVHTLFDVAVGGKHIVIRVAPDGLVQFVETGTRARVKISGARKNEVSLKLKEGELISTWPVVTIELKLGEADELVLEASAPDWAFVVRAEAVREGGVPVLVDGVRVMLVKGQRLDADIDAKTKKVVFRQTEQTWPGKVITMPAVAEPGREAPQPTIVVVAEPSLPGVILDRERDFPWQTIPLPVIAWEVFQPPDVSP